jgi:isopentenyldiphosphate isomerase
MVLLQKRKGGWADKQWDASVCGHVDHGEGPRLAAKHEAIEELCVNVDIKDMNFNSVVYKEVGGEDYAFYNFSFFTYKWKKTPIVGEKDKCYEIKWFDINKLPKNLIDDRKVSMKNFLTKNYYNECDCK